MSSQAHVDALSEKLKSVIVSSQHHHEFHRGLPPVLRVLVTLQLCLDRVLCYTPVHTTHTFHNTLNVHTKG
jgi:hypothetical protein